MLGCLGHFWALIRLGLLSGGVGPKSMVPTMPPFFPSGEFDLHQLEKYCVFDLVVVRNGEPLILACSNVHIFGEFFYFWDRI